MILRRIAFLTALAATGSVLPGAASGSVTLPGTRVIYDASLSERSLQFTNGDNAPSVMQVWVDSGDERSTPQTTDAPFVVAPPIFRIEPKAGQTVRLVFTGKDLPQDRESVFYLNTLQIPSISAANADQNQMLVLLRNRLKIFYRPAGVEGRPQNAYEKLAFHLQGSGNGTRITASNGSGYYLSLVGGKLTCGARTSTFAAGMLAPRADAEWDVQGNCPANSAKIRVKVHYVDDYGAVRETEYPVDTGSTK
jgi:fimbrial chaperone protein